jgi:2-polyprenyl-6-methoxyphenol hydroxylase-like FAD-dependent oxidoreductase
MSDLHVLITGGVGGLCLAQGLRKAGVSCAVYERDPGMKRDACILAARLAEAARGERGLLDAIGAYEDAMREYVYPIIDMSADHNRFGGGGLRQKAEV